MNEPIRLFAVHDVILREPQMLFWLIGEPQSGIRSMFSLTQLPHEFK